MTRIGPRMAHVLAYVAANPGLPMLRAARRVGPHGSTRYGYRAVHRAIAAGLVRRVRGPRRCWLLYVA